MNNKSAPQFCGALWHRDACYSAEAHFFLGHPAAMTTGEGGHMLLCGIFCPKAGKRFAI